MHHFRLLSSLLNWDSVVFLFTDQPQAPSIPVQAGACGWALSAMPSKFDVEHRKQTVILNRVERGEGSLVYLPEILRSLKLSQNDWMCVRSNMNETMTQSRQKSLFNTGRRT